MRTILGIITEDLAPLFNLLKGDPALNSPPESILDGQEAISKVQEVPSTRQAHRFDPELKFFYAVLGETPHLHALIFQCDDRVKNPLLIIEWVFLPNQPTKTITTTPEMIASLICRDRAHCHALAGCDFECIYVPIWTVNDLEHLIQFNESLQFSLNSFPGNVSIHYPGCGSPGYSFGRTKNLYRGV